jgi:hypothetical protein
MCRASVGDGRDIWTRVAIAASTLVLGVISAGPSVALASEGLGAGAGFGPFSTLGNPLQESNNLEAAMDSQGETTLVWRSSLGTNQSVVETAAIAPDAARAGPTMVLSHSASNSPATLSVASGGRAMFAWFEEPYAYNREDEEDQNFIRTLQVRNRLPNGSFEAPRTIWRPTAVPAYEEQALAAAVDPQGDEVVAWLVRRQKWGVGYPYTLMVSSRHAGGAFSAPTTLDANDETASPVAVGMSPAGEATVAWVDNNLLTTTWPAGSPPTHPTVLDRNGTEESQKGIGEVRLTVGSSGDELATWVKGPGSTAGRPRQAALRAAWRLSGRPFEPAVTVSSPGVEVREPTSAINAEGKALIAWTEITNTGMGPQIAYSTGLPGSAFSTPVGVSAPLDEHSNLNIGWLADGTALMTWPAEGRILASHWTPGASFPTPVTAATAAEDNSGILAGGEDSEMAAGGSSDPVIAWIGGTAGSTQDEALYSIASGLNGPAHPVVAPILTIDRSKQAVHKLGLVVIARCSERCRLTATVRVFAQGDAKSSYRYHEIGSFLAFVRTVAAGQTERPEIHLPRRLLHAYCRAEDNNDAIEVRLVAHGLESGASRTIDVGAAPGGGFCR